MRVMELRAIGERASMSFAAPLRRLLPRGDGHHVIVLPGFAADDRSTRPLRLLLRDLGYHSHGWRLGDNVGPTPAILAGLHALLERIHGDAAAPVSIIGWSLGGIYARELARATPDHVRQVITLGSPIQMIDHDSSSVQGSYDSLKNLHDPSVQRHVREAFLPMLETPATSIYSRTDGVVKWQASLIQRTARSENKGHRVVARCHSLDTRRRRPASSPGVGRDSRCFAEPDERRPLDVCEVGHRIVRP